MSWVCPMCSNNNDDAVTVCDVCGADRPVHITYPESTESRVVFSTLAVITESTKSNIRSIINLGAKVVGLVKKAGNAVANVGGKAVEKINARKAETPTAVAETVSTEAPRRERRIKTFGKKDQFAKPWPEHSIEMDIPEIKSKGYVRSERAELNSVKGYYFYTPDGNRKFIRSEMLVVIRMAKQK